MEFSIQRFKRKFADSGARQTRWTLRGLAWILVLLLALAGTIGGFTSISTSAAYNCLTYMTDKDHHNRQMLDVLTGQSLPMTGPAPLPESTLEDLGTSPDGNYDAYLTFEKALPISIKAYDYRYTLVD